MFDVDVGCSREGKRISGAVHIPNVAPKLLYRQSVCEIKKQANMLLLSVCHIYAQGRLPLGAGWAGQDWLLRSRRPQKHKVKVGFFQFDLKKDLDFILYQL